MFFDILKDIVYGNSFLYASILIIMFASFTGAILMSSIKVFQISKNAHYSSIFKLDVWNQSIDKSKNNALLIKEHSIIANLFIVGLKSFSETTKENKDYNSGYSISLAKSTMEIILKKEILYLTQGFGLLSFNAIFLPYASLVLALWSVIDIFNTVDIGVLTLTMFVNPLFVIVFGLMMAGISSVVYIISQNKTNEIEDISNLFISEFTNKLHKNYYK